MSRPDPTTDNSQHDQYVLERAVELCDGSKKSTGRIDLYRRGCFVLETKQRVNGVNAGFNYWKNAHGSDIGADPDSAKPLKANAGLSNPGVKLHGARFIVSPERAHRFEAVSGEDVLRRLRRVPITRWSWQYGDCRKA